MIGRTMAVGAAAFAATLASLAIETHDQEMAQYAGEGPVEQQFQPRELAGWPAPFLADRPGTSVIHNVGLEDNLRPGALIASWAFWYVALMLAFRLIGRLRGKR